MNLLSIFSKFPDQEACIEHLEKVRWAGEAHCPHCGGTSVARKADGGRMGRWNCYSCKSSFNVLAGTIFEKTKLPLQKWFLSRARPPIGKRISTPSLRSRDVGLEMSST